MADENEETQLRERETQLRERIRQIKQARQSLSIENRILETIEIVGKLSSPVAKVSMFSDSIGLIPDDIPVSDKRDLIDGYIELKMYREAARLSEIWFRDYDLAITNYLKAAQEAEDTGTGYLNAAAKIIKEDLGDTQRAINIYVENGDVHGAISHAIKWGETTTALTLAEKNGCFREAEEIACKLGDRSKEEFYGRVLKNRRKIHSKKT